MVRDVADDKTLDLVQQAEVVQVKEFVSQVDMAKQAEDELNNLIDQSNPKTRFASSFSEEDTRDLITMWNKHYTVREIAGYLGRSFNNVRNKVAALQKKGLIKARDTRNKISQSFIMETAGKFGVPIDVVLYLSSLFTGGSDKIMEQTTEAVEMYKAQGGKCYYLGDMVHLTMDDTPSGVVVVRVKDKIALVCRAVAGMRMATTHETFLGICRLIAQRFNN